MTSVTKAVVENHVTDDVGRQLSDISRQESNLSNISNLSNTSVVSELEKQQHEIERQQSEIERQQQEMKKQQEEVERQQQQLERQKSEMEKQHREAMNKLEQEMLEMKVQMNQLKKSTTEMEELKEEMEKRLDDSNSEASNDPDKATTGHVDLTRISTYDTRLYMCGNMIVVPNTGDIVLYGKSTESDKLAYHIYHEVNEKLTHRMMKDTCDHDYYVRMLPVVVEGKNRLCVTCPGCEDIKLFSLHSGGCLPAFQDRKYTPYRMCHGKEGRVFMHSYSDPFPIVELDVTEQEFTGPTQTLTSMGTWETWGMCYLPEPFNAVVLTDVTGGVIRAISYERDNVMWEVKGKVNDIKVDPRGVTFYPDHQVVLVCDGSNERILVLNPKDGSHMHSIDLGMNASKQENKGRGMGKIMNISLYRDHAVVQHYAHKKFKVSFFNIK